MTGETPTPRPIRDYAPIGDCYGATHVSREAGIHWNASLRFVGDPSSFDCSTTRAVAPGRWMISREYLPNIAILRNRFETAIGVLDLLDYMPVGRKREAGVHDYVSLAAPRLAGSVGCGPLGRGVRQDAFRARGEGFEHASPGFEIVDDGAQFEDGSTLWCAAEIQPAPDGGGIEAAFRLSKGEHLKAALTWLRPLHDPRTSVDTAFHATCAFFGLSIIACSGEGRRFSEFLSKRCLRPGRGNAHHLRPR